ncbi:hypothetical protein ACOME3_000020, partial [Neoechinorhynchus agilis]
MKLVADGLEFIGMIGYVSGAEPFFSLPEPLQIREPSQRKGRLCIRPEISRTAANPKESAKGASNGEFFYEYISKVQPLNEKVAKQVDWKAYNLSYLSNYEENLRKIIAQCTKIDSIDDLHRKKAIACVRLYYTDQLQLVSYLRELALMSDLKAGVPRTAFKGIVQTFID